MVAPTGDDDAEIGDKRKAEEGMEECGLEVIEDLNRAFRTWVEDRQWLNMRLCVSTPLLSKQCSLPCRERYSR